MPGVYISYVHTDDQPFAQNTEGWVTHFRRYLSGSLSRWADSADAEPELADAGVLLILLSRQWLATESCLRDLKLFCETHPDCTQRVFVAELDRIDAGDKLIIMQDFPAYPFWQQTCQAGDSRQGGYPLPQAADADYFRLLVDLSHDLACVLNYPHSKAAEPEAPAAATVYVAPVGEALYRERSRLISELRQFGIIVLPPSNRLDGQVEHLLAQCSHFVQLLDEQWLMGVPFNLYLTAEYTRKPVLQWRNPQLEYSGDDLPDEQRFLLKGKSVQVTPLADFIRTVRNVVLPGTYELETDDRLADQAEQFVNSLLSDEVDSLPDHTGWSVVKVRPAKHPYQQLAKALLGNKVFADSWLLPSTGESGANDPALLMAELGHGSRSLHEILQRAPLPVGPKLLLLMTHFDEVFSARKQDREQVAAFVALLREAGNHPDIVVLVSNHSDASGKATGFRELSRLINQGMYSTSRLWAGDQNDDFAPETRPKPPMPESVVLAAGRMKQRQLAFTAMGSLAMAGSVWWGFSDRQENATAVPAIVSSPATDSLELAVQPQVEEPPKVQEAETPRIEKPPEPEPIAVEIDPEVAAAGKKLRQAVAANPEDVDAITELAIFMRDMRQDNDQTTSLFRQAIELAPDNVNIRDSYTIFLQLNRHDYAAAEKQYRKILKVMPENPNTLANYAQALLAQGKLAEGREQLDAAFKHYSADYPQSLLLELWFYRLAHFPADYPKAKTELGKLLETGERDEGWDFSGNIAQAEKAGHPDLVLLKELSAIILGETELHTLAKSSGE